jgi:heme exporter protein A
VSYTTVELLGITKRFGHTTALRNVSACFRAGELSLVVGANGSGKSTMLGLLGLTSTPTHGELRFDGKHGVAAMRGTVGLLSHELLCYADLTGRQNIELAAEVHGLDAAEAWERSKSRFELGPFAERPVRTNSRGQRQRIALARALLHEPALVLLDEPTTGLDLAGSERLVQVLREEVERGAVAVVVTHDDLAFSGLATHRLRLERGRVIEDERFT